MSTNLLSVENVSVTYDNAPVLKEASFHVEKNEIVGVVGESGSGKSTMIYAILGMLCNGGSLQSGRIIFDGVDLTKIPPEQMRKIRGSEMALIAQNPVQSFHPTRRIKDQLREIVRSHPEWMTYPQAEQKLQKLLENMRIPDAKRILKSYAFQLSGGLCQRASIGLGMVLSPKLILADEPTSALDVTVQAQVVEELRKVRSTHGTSMVVVSHNMGVISHLADRMIVMFAGRILETGATKEVLQNPLHPYTQNLIKSVPSMRTTSPVQVQTFHADACAQGCPICAECEKAQERCKAQFPEQRTLSNGHTVCCWQAELEER